MIYGQLLFKIAACFYGMSLICTFVFGQRSKAVLFVLMLALLANMTAVGWRYWLAWPMLPMYMGPVVLPLFLGVMLVLSHHRDGGWTWPAILTLIVMIALAAVLFPKDYYIPFVKSQTIWAHLFFWFGVGGRGCFLIAAAWAVAGLTMARGETERVRSGDTQFKSSPRHPLSPSPHHRISPASRSMQWTVWGFAFWTLSMFTGELWSYMGWGTPVVWDDPAITTTMATWFFYICLLHLHLTGSWTVRGRGIYTAAGALVVLVLNCVPELGPFRWPL